MDRVVEDTVHSTIRTQAFLLSLA